VNPSAKTARDATLGVVWTSAAFALDKAAVFVTSLVLARLLTVGEFGTVATALLVLGIANAFRDFGISDALIYLDPSREAKETAFVMQLAVGVVLAGLVGLFGFFALRRDPLFSQLVMLWCPLFLINAASAAHGALLKKQLRFRDIAVIDMKAALFKLIATLALALAGLGVLAATVGTLVATCTRSRELWLADPWVPRLRFHLPTAYRLLHFGKSVFLTALITSTLLRSDQIAIAYFLGPTAMSFYFVASRVPELLIMQISEVLTRVTFPVFASVSGSQPALRGYVLECTHFLSFALVPVAVGLASTADLLVPALFGERWSEASPMLSLLAIAGLARGLVFGLGDGLKASGRPDLVFKLELLEAVITLPIVCFAAYVFRTPYATCVGALAAAVLTAGMRLWVSWSVQEITLGNLFAATRGGWLAGAALLLAVILTRSLNFDLPVLVRFLSTVIVSALVYAAVLWCLERQSLLTVIRALSQRAGDSRGI
jgi:O-antigen/teichoic acid export membrane protein